jgi:hypothetical protein
MSPPDNHLPIYHFDEEIDDETFRAFNTAAWQLDLAGIHATPERIAEVLAQQGVDITIVPHDGEYEVHNG